MAEESLVQQSQASTPSTLAGSKSGSSHPVHKTLVTASNLANLLPTGTVLAFQALIPSFSNGGSCHVSHKYLTASLITFCSMCCFLSSFTDSFKGCNGKLYYGISTFRGLYIFNYDMGEERMHIGELAKFRISFIDFVHAFVSLFVFLTFAFSNSDVLGCYFSDDEKSNTSMMLSMNFPIGAGVMSSFLFTIFPTTRRGIGYSDIDPRALFRA